MKLLQVDAIYRHYLIDRGALVLDQYGDEVLIGSSRDESIEYVSMINADDIVDRIKDITDPKQLLKLYERHAAARPKLPSIFTPVSPSDWQPRRK